MKSLFAKGVRSTFNGSKQIKVFEFTRIAIFLYIKLFEKIF